MRMEPFSQPQPRRVFLFLVAFRWAALLPGVWLVLQGQRSGNSAATVWALALAAGNTLLVSAFHRSLNRLLQQRPALLGIDLALAAGLLGASGGVHSPLYLYALSPLLAGAFFFRVRGALLSSASFSAFYLLALAAFAGSWPTAAESNLLITQLVGVWLVPILVAYPSVLLQELKEAHQALQAARDDLELQNQELGNSHRQLTIIHDLTLLLQAAPDIRSVQERVLTAVTQDLGLARASVGLVEPGAARLGHWRRASREPRSSHPLPPLAMAPESGPLIQGLLAHKAQDFPAGSELAAKPGFGRALGAGPWFSFPLNLREHPVGVLLVSPGNGSGGLTGEQRTILDVVASQAAVSLGTTMLCIDRARNLAVEQERNRIARDIHDTVAQSLFGVVFSLDACLTMLPEQAERVQGELEELRDLASRVRDEVRNSIFDLWPTELNLQRFKADLRSYATQCCRPQMFHVEFDTAGDFDHLPPGVRRSLYRVAQEGLANAARHSGAGAARVSMQVADDQVRLRVHDQGQGFKPGGVLSGERDRERFGLLGIKERVEALGGRFEIESQEGAGTTLKVDVPLEGAPALA